MNNAKRARLKTVKLRLGLLQKDLESVKDEVETEYDDEQSIYDNFPENLQSSERYEICENACSNLQDAIDSLNEATEQIESAISSLEDAAE